MQCGELFAINNYDTHQTRQPSKLPSVSVLLPWNLLKRVRWRRIYSPRPNGRRKTEDGSRAQTTLLTLQTGCLGTQTRVCGRERSAVRLADLRSTRACNGERPILCSRQRFQTDGRIPPRVCYQRSRKKREAIEPRADSRLLRDLVALVSQFRLRLITTSRRTNPRQRTGQPALTSSMSTYTSPDTSTAKSSTCVPAPWRSVCLMGPSLARQPPRSRKSLLRSVSC